MLSSQAEKRYEDAGPKGEAAELLAGLLSDQKYLPCKYFYDETGSRLFEEISRLEEYYPSRTEKAILGQHAEKLMRGIQRPSLIELGSGDCSKISILLHAIPKATLDQLTYVPIDVSPSAVEASRRQLQARFGPVAVQEIIADFTTAPRLARRHENRIFCFFGSTIGNLDRAVAGDFIAGLGRMLRPGERLLLGLDMVKDITVMERAYNDTKGVTVRFNKNILTVANQILAADFEPDYFRHRAFYHERRQRIEMHLVATRDMAVTSPFFEGDIKILKGQSIHTENAHKFTFDHILEFAAMGGLSVRAIYTDSNEWFTLTDFIK